MGTVDWPGLDELWDEIRECEEFEHLRLPGISLVPGIGPDRPKAMLVGEAPGAQENFKKLPFVGAAGSVLSQLMSLARLSTSSNAWLTNTIKFRPPLNRTPTPEEIRDAQPFLRREWYLVGRPRVLVAVGAVAWRAMAPAEYENTPVSKVVGEPLQSGAHFLWPMFHPAFAMRNKSIRPRVEEHWVALGQWLTERQTREIDRAP